MMPNRSGALSYEPVPRWLKVPHGMTFGAGANAVAVDAEDGLVVFNRGSDPVAKFDKGGNFVGSWGHGEFVNPHAIALCPNGDYMLVDDLGHCVQRRSPDGELLLTLGVQGRASEAQGGQPFNRPTDVAVVANGDMFVTDGYANSRVHHFSPDGRLIGGWGDVGSDTGEFNLPHHIAVTARGTLAVCDRENHRVQFFSVNGEYVDSWHFHRPVAIATRPDLNSHLYVAELPPEGWQRQFPGIGLRVRVVDENGRQVGVIGDGTPGEGPSQFIAPHGIAIDSVGDVYVAELSARSLDLYDDVRPYGETVSLRKWRQL